MPPDAQMGYAHGQMMRDEVRQLYSDIDSFYSSIYKSAFTRTLPSELARQAALAAMKNVLDLVTNATRPYSGGYFFEEAQVRALVNACRLS